MTTKSNRLPLDDEPTGNVSASPENETADTGVPTEIGPIGEAQKVPTESAVNDGGADKTKSIEGAEDVKDAEDAEDAEDHNCTEDFKPAAAVPGEFLAPVRDLGEWEYHLRRFSPLKASHGAALALTASDPRYLRPIVVLEKDGKYRVVDGRFILEAIKAQHPGNDEVMVRVVRFNGDEGAAVATMCDGALGMAVATRMEMAHGLLALQRANRISQTALAERYAALTKDKVSQMLIAARLQEAYPVLFEALEEPHKAPISLAVALNKAVKAMVPTDFADLIDRAQKLAKEGERCGPADLFEQLRIPHQRGNKATGSIDMTIEQADEAAEAIFGHDDQPVGTVERVSGGGERLSLPSQTVVTGMNQEEREAAAAGFIIHIKRHFGLDPQN